MAWWQLLIGDEVKGILCMIGFGLDSRWSPRRQFTPCPVELSLSVQLSNVSKWMVCLHCHYLSLKHPFQNLWFLFLLHPVVYIPPPQKKKKLAGTTDTKLVSNLLLLVLPVSYTHLTLPTKLSV